MYEYRVHTLVDITDNGILQRQFPFKTHSGDLIHNKETLQVARQQNSNFNTMIQLLQMRGNITWDYPPMKINTTLGNTSFGSAYEGKQNCWHFAFHVDQPEVYGDDRNPTSSLVDDFHLVPILNFCKETATFPTSTFITNNTQTINTYFSYSGKSDK